MVIQTRNKQVSASPVYMDALVSGKLIYEQQLRILDKNSLIILTGANYRRCHMRVVIRYALEIFRYGLEILLIILSSII